MTEKVSTKQAAEMLGVSRFTVGVLVRARRIPHYRIGRKIVFLERHRVATALQREGDAA
jgi:excisionase family DNA binding protein